MRRSPATLLASLSLLAACAGCVGGATPYPPSASTGADAGTGAASHDGSSGAFDAAAPPPAGDGGPDFVTDGDIGESGDAAAMDGDLADGSATDAETPDAGLDDASIVDDGSILDGSILDGGLPDGAVPDASPPGPDGPPDRLPREP